MFWHHGQKVEDADTNFKKFLRFSWVANGGQTDLEEILLNLETCCNYNPNYLTNGLFPHKSCPHRGKQGPHESESKWSALHQNRVDEFYLLKAIQTITKYGLLRRLHHTARGRRTAALAIPVPEQIGVARLKLRWSSSHVNESESEVSMQPWQRMSDYSVEY